jgi:hypothetical protein
MTDTNRTTDPVSHTPGPWWVERRVGDALQVNAKHRGEGSSYCVASINHWEGDADRANACLIAAAPEMWAILHELEGAFDEEIYPEQVKEDFDALPEREYSVTITAKQWRAISQALTKAKQP